MKVERPTGGSPRVGSCGYDRFGRVLSVPSEGSVRPVPLKRDLRLAAALCPKLAGCPDSRDAQHKGQCHKDSLPARPMFPRPVGTFLQMSPITSHLYAYASFGLVQATRLPPLPS